MARIDDVINTAGHRLSTGQMEQTLMINPHVAEAIVIGVKDEIRGEVPIGLITLKKGVNDPHEKISKSCIELIREHIGPVACFRVCLVIPAVPRTRSGKYLRGVLKKIAQGETYKVPATIEDESVLPEI